MSVAIKMMNIIKESILKINGKKVLLLIVVTNIVYAMMLMITIPNTLLFSNGMNLFNRMPFGYDFDYANALLKTLGSDGRKFYLLFQIPMDLVYSILFGLSYCFMIGYFLKRVNRINSISYYLCFVPVIAALAEYLQILGIITLLKKYPSTSQFLVNFTSFFAVFKSILMILFIFILIYLLILFVLKVFKVKVSIDDPI